MTLMHRWRWERWLIGGVVVAAVSGVGYVASIEMRTSWLQAGILSKYAKELTYEVKDGPADLVSYPAAGPYNERLGYSQLPRYVEALTRLNYRIDRQAEITPELERFMHYAGRAVYREKTRGGITVKDRNGSILFSARYPERAFEDFESVPRLVVDTLLFIENRELLDTENPMKNPAVEWDRFAFAIMGLPLQWVHPGTRIPGGSTLATQIEKYRHSPDGQTQGATDKLRQMVAASVRSYLDGQDTTYARRRIVVDYLNSTPLTARLGFGEVNGLGDGLWAWYGTDFNEAARVLRAEPAGPKELARKAQVYKQALSLLIAQRRPSYYLIQNRADLEELCDSHLRLMASQGVIGPELRDAALAAHLRFREDTPAPPEVSFIDQKASNAIRARLLGMMGVPSLYALDRLDVTVDTALDAPMQERIAGVLGRLDDAKFTEELGLTGFRLLSNTASASADRVIYSFVLYERGKEANYVRIQADNLDQPLDINEGAKLDLGSTAKLRTLITYLEIIQELHGRYAHLPRKQLLAVAEEADDGLTRWVATYLAEGGSRSLPAMLDAAMERRYSANPGERFFTGGGVHTFVNFDAKDNGSFPTVTEAIRHSVNLPFIRMMRDIVQYHVAEMVGETGNPIEDPSHPARQEYLAKFADEEGSHFLNRFYNDYRGKSADEQLALLASRVRPVPHRLAVTFRSVRPDAPFAEFAAFMKERLPKSDLDAKDLQRLFEKYAIDKFNLQDRGYIAGRHPLELWLVGHLNANPDSNRTQALAASASERQETYAWLFKSSRKAAQDTRIRILMEEEAFKRIHAAWARLGYPFETLVPSYATSIGSSADRPGALADLMGVIVNDGVKLQTVRVEKLHFAAGTPYETAMSLAPRAPERVLSPEITSTVRRALIDIAENGTAKRVRGAFGAPNGGVLPVGGKTGTGDHRYGERVVARTATFVFLIGDRFFGTVTAHVRGPEAARYRFTSALPAQLLKSLAPTLQPLIDRSLTQTVESTPALPGPGAGPAAGPAPAQVAPAQVAPAQVTPAAAPARR